MKYYCYILSNRRRTLLYIGYTSNLLRRISEHKKGSGAVFTGKYSVHDLIYYEEFDDKSDAKKREKQLKNWHKEWKWNLIKGSNPELLTIEL